MSETGVAFIGAGYITYMHLFALRALPGLRLAAIASRRRQTAVHRGRIFDAPAYGFDQLPDMIGREDVQVVLVASPNALHFEHAMAAVQLGRNVIIEKPLVLTLAQCAELARAAQERGVGIGYAENLVFAPIVVRAREVVQSGVLGRIERAHCTFKHGGPPVGGWFRSRQFAGGGAHIDLGCHALEILLYLLGRPVIASIQDCSMGFDTESGLDLTALVSHVTQDGVAIVTDSSWSEPNGETRCTITGEKGTLSVAISGQALELARNGQTPETLEFPLRKDFSMIASASRGGYVAQMANFVDAFTKDATPCEGIAEGTNVLRLVAAAYGSQATRAPFLPANVPDDLAPIEIARRLAR